VSHIARGDKEALAGGDIEQELQGLSLANKAENVAAQ
jgi:hypothetical protein